jgi:gentisate 1,2-dioxygenase
MLIAGIALIVFLYVGKPGFITSSVAFVLEYLRSMEQVTPTTYRYVPKDTPYEKWLDQAAAVMPLHQGLFIEDVRSTRLQAWPEMGEGVTGLYLRFADYQITDGRLLQIPADGKTFNIRHLYEMVVYVLDGSGHTILEGDGYPAQRIDWSRDSIFSIPLNVRYQHFNDSDKPIRLFAVTSFPFVINSWDNIEFINENPFSFNDRYSAQPSYFNNQKLTDRVLVETNLVPNASQYKLLENRGRGKGAKIVYFDMANNEMLNVHISSSPPKSTKRAHRHNSDAFILILEGRGYSVTWPESNYEKRIRVDWQPGTLFVPPTYWYHQHFNAGAKSARYLAINAPLLVRRLGIRLEDQLEQNLPELQKEWEAEIESGGQQDPRVFENNNN